jgi:hypothetical protein
VDGDDGAEAGALVGAEDDLFVAVEVFEDGRLQLLGHGGDLSSRRGPARVWRGPVVKRGRGGADAGLVYETPITVEVLESGHIPFTTFVAQCQNPKESAGEADRADVTPRRGP